MSETEKQEGQKTVVAFIAGLLIGGLLVWVFSSTPEEEATNTPTDDTSEEMSNSSNGSNNRSSSNGNGTASNANDTRSDTNQTSQVIGEGSLVVADQAAGSVVAIDSVTFPTEEGWVVVRDYENGNPGSVLGAARYEVEVGLVPSDVRLLRATESGSTYQVTFYSESGDQVFDLADDQPIEGSGVTFTAQ